MACRTILGKPGGGKSYFALLEIIEELVFGIRTIVTNLPLDLGALNAYLQKNYPNADIDLHKRVRLLTEEETKFFFAHREYGRDFVIPSEEETKRTGAHIQYGDPSLMVPVFYIIDEAHVCFDARAWMTSGPHLTFYNSQHRKFGDEVWFITQFLALLDKRCTGFSQEFITVRNYGMERLAFFKGPKGQHVATTTLSKPDGNAVVTNTRNFRLDVEIANCYCTTAGVGIMSGRSSKPREKETKGLQWWYAIPLVVLVIIGLIMAPDLIGKAAVGGLNKMTGVATKATTAAVGRASGNPPVPPFPSPIQPPPEYNNSRQSSAHLAAPLPQVWVDGIIWNAGRVTVILTDGREYEGAEIKAIAMDGCQLQNGEVYRMKPRPPRKQKPMEDAVAMVDKPAEK